jgi:hypothetical protein
MGNDSIKRYTELPFVLQTLQEKKIALLSPASWDDKNDGHYIRRYKQKKKLKGVFALCLTEAIQTYHHWKVFTHGASGACIHFRANEFQEWANSTKGLSGRSVAYRTIAELRAVPPTVVDLPFLKRGAYEHEAEYRLLHESKATASGPVRFSFPAEIIERVVLNPWLNPDTVKSIRELIHSINGWDNLSVIRATIVRNDEWRRLADAAE